MVQASDDTFSGTSGSTAPSQVAGAQVSRIAERVATDRTPAVEVVPFRVALLCAQQRLRTILRLALLAADYEVVEWVPPRSGTVEVAA
jgi:hypothetical protein